MPKLMIHIRPERPEDIVSIDGINRLAFGGEEEAKLIKAIRGSNYFLPELSLVAAETDRIVGHILFSPITVESSGKSVNALALAPMAVVPEYQNKGVGTALVKHGLAACKKLGYTIVIVVGHPEYYSRFGFTPATEYDLEAPFEVPDDAFLALELLPGALKNVRGMVKYSPAFDSVL